MGLLGESARRASRLGSNVVELRHLEYFVAVAEERHFTRAAQRLMVPQSGLSASVRALERELGARLFVRSTRRVEPTGAGRALLVEASRALASVRAGREAAAAVQGLCAALCPSARSSASRGCMSPACSRGSGRSTPRSRYGCGRRALPRSWRMWRTDGRLDLAFVAMSGTVPERVRLVPLAREPMVLLCHPDHPLAGAEKAEWADLVRGLSMGAKAPGRGRQRGECGCRLPPGPRSPERQGLVPQWRSR